MNSEKLKVKNEKLLVRSYDLEVMCNKFLKVISNS